MKIVGTPLAGVWVVESAPFRDQRGIFTRLFCDLELRELLGSRNIVQINRSLTWTQGGIRGLHYQLPPFAEMKLIRCLRGKVWDVAADLRRGSPSFGQWFATELSQDNDRMLVVPEGCAHGFQTLTPDCEMLYLHTAAYSPEHYGRVRWDDPVFGIRWPLPAQDLSVPDRDQPSLPPGFQGIAS